MRRLRLVRRNALMVILIIVLVPFLPAVAAVMIANAEVGTTLPWWGLYAVYLIVSAVFLLPVVAWRYTRLSGVPLLQGDIGLSLEERARRHESAIRSRMHVPIPSLWTTATALVVPAFMLSLVLPLGIVSCRRHAVNLVLAEVQAKRDSGRWRAAVETCQKALAREREPRLRSIYRERIVALAKEFGTWGPAARQMHTRSLRPPHDRRALLVLRELHTMVASDAANIPTDLAAELAASRNLALEVPGTRWHDFAIRHGWIPTLSAARHELVFSITKKEMDRQAYGALADGVTLTRYQITGRLRLLDSGHVLNEYKIVKEDPPLPDAVKVILPGRVVDSYNTAEREVRGAVGPSMGIVDFLLTQHAPFPVSSASDEHALVSRMAAIILGRSAGESVLGMARSYPMSPLLPTLFPSEGGDADEGRPHSRQE